MTTTYYLLRHGKPESHDNDIERILSDIGIDQAVHMRRKLPDSFDLIISSPAKRSIETASVLTHEANIEIVDSLYDLMKAPENDEAYPRLKNSKPLAWLNDDKIGPLVKSNAEDYMPEIRALVNKVPDPKNILIVSHGLITNMIAYHLADSDSELQEYFMQLDLGECEGIKITVNSTGDLPMHSRL